MAGTPERYVIRGGKAGYDRLLVLARHSWPETLALFQRAGLRPGMRCVDVGCGGGAVTLEMAKLVAPGGAVVGIDMDEVKLGLARQAADELQLGQVEFRQLNVNEWDETNTYDAVYSRFLLQHLKEPGRLVRRMWAAVRPGGLLIVEDADFDGWCCDPPNESFDFFVRTYSEAARRNGGDATTGRKLHRLFREAGVSDPKLAIIQRISREPGARALPLLTLEFSSEAIVSAGIATPTALATALTGLAKFIEDPQALISGPRVFQAWARRPLTG